MTQITITEYEPTHQKGIDQMMRGIQREFSELISSPESTKIYEAYKLPDQKYWVALDKNKVIGTIGIVLYSGNTAVIKRMMVDRAYRGAGTEVAKNLLGKSINFAKMNCIETIFLGTMEQFKAAQKFYLKNGFVEIKKEELPKDYVSNPIDTIYYRLDIA